MDSWTKFDESSLPNWDTFYSKLNIEDNSEPNYKHPKLYGVPLKSNIWVIITICKFEVRLCC